MTDALSSHLPPQPLFNRNISGPRDGSVNCMNCGNWPAPRYIEDRQRLCEECYSRRAAEESS